MNEIASRRPGSTARLGYLRDGKQDDTTVTIGDRDKVFANLGSASPTPIPTTREMQARRNWDSSFARFPGNRNQAAQPGCAHRIGSHRLIR